MPRRKKSLTSIAIDSRTAGEGRAALTISIEMSEANFELAGSLSNHGIYPSLKEFLTASLQRTLQEYLDGAELQIAKVKSTFGISERAKQSPAS